MKNILKIADTILTQMPGGLEDREQKKPLKFIDKILNEDDDNVDKLSNEILNTKIITIADLFHNTCEPCMKKKAMTIWDLIEGTSQRSVKYEPGCEAKLKRSSPKLGRWLFTVKCGEKWSKGPYNVRFKLLKKGRRYREMIARQIEVSCDCNAWKYNGADFNAMEKGYSERQTSDGSKPNIRDRRRKYLMCKHVATAATPFIAFLVPKGFK